MGLRALASMALALCACASSVPKRLVIPGEMRRPVASQAAPAPAAPPAAPAKTRPTVVDPYAPAFNFTPPPAPTPAGTDDMTAAKPAAPAPTATPATPGPGAAAPPGAQPKATALPLKPPAAQPQPPTLETQRYTLRLVERGRVWEMELPESTGGYEVRIPLGPGIETPTAADQEMLGKTPPEGRSKSYLATLAKVGEMYKSHRFELALIEVVDLEQQYPKDARLQAMKGSLYQKLGKSGLAREAWKKSLELDPTDTTVAEALRALKEE